MMLSLDISIKSLLSHRMFTTELYNASKMAVCNLFDIVALKVVFVPRDLFPSAYQ